MTGGTDCDDNLDSTEVYDPRVGSWVMTGAKLPTPMCCLSAINIDDQVLIFGRFLNIISEPKKKEKNY